MGSFYYVRVAIQKDKTKATLFKIKINSNLNQATIKHCQVAWWLGFKNIPMEILHECKPQKKKLISSRDF